jgi:hypothetical protein
VVLGHGREFNSKPEEATMPKYKLRGRYEEVIDWVVEITVEADSPEEAIQIAEDSPGEWDWEEEDRDLGEPEFEVIEEGEGLKLVGGDD